MHRNHSRRQSYGRRGAHCSGVRLRAAAVGIPLRVPAADGHADDAARRRERAALVQQALRRPAAGRGEVDAGRRLPGRGRRRPGAPTAARPSGSAASASATPATETRPERSIASTSPGSRSRAPTSAARSTGRAGPVRSSWWHQPSRIANGMPPRNPDGEVSGVFRSPWASSQTSARSGCRSCSAPTRPGSACTRRAAPAARRGRPDGAGTAASASTAGPPRSTGTSSTGPPRAAARAPGRPPCRCRGTGSSRVRPASDQPSQQPHGIVVVEDLARIDAQETRLAEVLDDGHERLPEPPASSSRSAFSAGRAGAR